MNARTLAWNLALATAAAWTVKALFIWQAGGLDRSDFEGPMFFAGLLLAEATWFTFGVIVTQGRPAWLRVVGGVVSALLPLLLVSPLDTASKAALPDSAGWVASELSLWIMALVTVLVAWMLRTRGRVDPAAATA